MEVIKPQHFGLAPVAQNRVIVVFGIPTSEAYEMKVNILTKPVT